MCMLPYKSNQKKKGEREKERERTWGDCDHMKLLIETELYIITAQCMRDSVSQEGAQSIFIGK